MEHKENHLSRFLKFIEEGIHMHNAGMGRYKCSIRWQLTTIRNDAKWY